MLEQLSIKNYALIEDLRVDFAAGFNVLTGETGAGKSIIIGALGLILGERAAGTIIRKGAEACIIRASFDISKNKPIAKLLREQGLDIEDNSLLLCREITASGKNKCLVNDQPVTLGTLETIGGYLVDLHGQHEHQAILLSREQLNILDDFGGLMPMRERLKTAYEEFSGWQREFNDLLNNEKERAHFIDLYQFQSQEIAAAGLRMDEEEELEKEINLLNNAEKIFALANEMYQMLYEEDGAVLAKLEKTRERLRSLTAIDGKLAPAAKLLEEGLVDLEEVNSAIRDYKDKIVFDPVKLDQLIERKEMISRLKTKYGADIREVLAYKARIDRELDKLTNLEENKAGLQAKLTRAKEKALEIAGKLTAGRQKQALLLEKEAEKELKGLGLPKLKFKIEWRRSLDAQGQIELTAAGAETVDFLISPNVGEELKPLAQIASGGEMSRIMLALKTVLASSDQIPVLIFDEIDTGIGGSMAEVVGRKMAALAGEHQVICVTHWPQIAGAAGYHLQVSKEVKNDRTYTRIRELAGKDRIQELARMLGGETLTEISLKHAQELLKIKS